MKKFLIGLTCIGLVAALVLAGYKHVEESENNTVELIVDYGLLASAGQADLLPELEAAGVSALAMSKHSLQALEENGALGLYSGETLALLGPEFESFDVAADSFYVLPHREALFHDLRQALEAMGGNHDLYDAVNWYAADAQGVIELENMRRELLDIPLVYRRAAGEKAEAMGLDKVLKIPADSRMDVVAAHLEQTEARMAIFDGALPGYPGDIPALASLLQAHDVKYGFVEPFLAAQPGDRSLARLMEGDQVLRVHNMREAFMDDADTGVTRGINRYMRAVEERNVRALYLHPYSRGGAAETLAFIEGTAAALQEEGYELGPSRGFGPFDGFQFALLIGLATIGATAGIARVGGDFGEALGLFSGPLRGKKEGFYLALFVLGCLVLGGLYWLDVFYTREIFALVFSLAVPVGLYLYLERGTDRDIDGSVERSAVARFMAAAGITLAGGLMIQGILFGEEFIYQARMFRGVRVQLVLPMVAMLCIYAYTRIASYEKGERLAAFKAVMQRPLLVKDALYIIGVLFILMVAVVAMLLLDRAAADPLIPIPDIEMAVREFLEDFGVRPRFKSLLGYPLFLLGIYWSALHKKFMLLVVAGMLGPITTLNTFSHLHSPVLVSVFREVIGILFGLGVGLALIYLTRKRWRLL